MVKKKLEGPKAVGLHQQSTKEGNFEFVCDSTNLKGSPTNKIPNKRSKVSSIKSPGINIHPKTKNSLEKKINAWMHQ